MEKSNCSVPFSLPKTYNFQKKSEGKSFRRQRLEGRKTGEVFFQKQEIFLPGNPLLTTYDFRL